MATRFAVATVKPRRRPPPPEPEKPKGKPLIEVLHNPDLDVEKKFDPNLGELVAVEPKKYKLYPSAEVGARVAKCYVCNEVKNKEVMICLGQNHAEKGSLRYVWRCKEMKAKDGHIKAKGCEAGSESWLKHFAHKTPMGKLWGIEMGSEKREKRKGLEEEALAIGTQIIEKIKAKYSKEIAERLVKRDAKREAGKKLAATLKKGAEKHGGKNVRVEIEPERRRTVAPVAAPTVAKKRKRRSGRNVVIRRV
jgi:hypothetical protein